MSGRIRRALDGAVDSERRFGNTLEVSKEGRLEVKIAKGQPIKQTRQGLVIDEQAVGEMNREPMRAIDDIPTGSTLAVTITKVNELLAELRRTKNLRGGF